MTEVKDAQEVESKETETVTEAVAETKVEAVKEETVGEVLNPEKKEPKLVPEAVLLEYKNANKELKRDLKELKTLIESGATKKVVSTDIKAIAEEHNVDIDFLEKLASALEARADEKVSSKMKPLEEKERLSKINEVFEASYAKALEKMPEYKDIANKEVIKSLSLDPANQNKTWTQIIEGAYGHLIQGRKTFESSAPSGSKGDDQEVDFDKARKDSNYFNEVMASPTLKAKYNNGLAERLKL
jgi:hypothetical protein